MRKLAGGSGSGVCSWSAAALRLLQPRQFEECLDEVLPWHVRNKHSIDTWCAAEVTSPAAALCTQTTWLLVFVVAAKRFTCHVRAAKLHQVNVSQVENDQSREVSSYIATLPHSSQPTTTTTTITANALNTNSINLLLPLLLLFLLLLALCVYVP